MYESYWNLKEKPFQNTPNPRYLYLSPQHEDVLMKLTYVAAQGLGCGMLTGVFGCGKTLLARAILRDLGEKIKCAYICYPSFSQPAEFLRAVARALIPYDFPEKKTELMADALLEKIHEALVDNIRDGKENLVIVDEAHTISDSKIFEQLRLILNFQTEDKFLLTLLILGQPELEGKVDALKPLSQRIPVRCNLKALSEEETGKYITYRIKVAFGEGSGKGTRQPAFGKEEIKAVQKYTGGIPRKINTLCDFILLSGFAKKVDKISVDFIDSVIKDFNLS